MVKVRLRALTDHAKNQGLCCPVLTMGGINFGWLNEVIPLCINYIYLLYYIIPSTQHKSLSYRYMFRLNKSSSGVSKNHKTNYNMPVKKTGKTTTDITRTTRTTAPRSSTHVTPNIHVDTIVRRDHVICESQHTL